MKVNSNSNQSFGSLFRVNLGRELRKDSYRLGLNAKVDEFISKLNSKIRENNDVSIYREDADLKGIIHHYFINILNGKKDKKVLDLAKKFGVECSIVPRYEVKKHTANHLVSMGKTCVDELSTLLQVKGRKWDRELN